MHGRLVASRVLLEHLLGRVDDDLISREASGAKEHRLELLLNVTVLLGELPTKFMNLGARQVLQEVPNSVLGLLILEHPGTLNRGYTGNELVPDDKLGLGAETLEEA